MRTLSAPYPRAPKPAAPAAKPVPWWKAFIGRRVRLQARSPSELTGTLAACDGGVLILDDATERRWQPDGSLGDPVTLGRVVLDRNVMHHLYEVPA